MANILGTTGNDILNGTVDPDVITALAGNDTVNAGAGNDVIYGGLGNDTLNGEDGDDLFIQEEFTQVGEIFNGGTGFDTLELRSAPAPAPTSLGPFTSHNLSGPTQLSSVETLQFSSQVGLAVGATLSLASLAASGLTQIVGGAGRNFLTISTGTGAGTFLMPNLPLTNWDAVPVNAWENTGDLVILASSAAAGVSVTLNALAGASFLQAINGGAGADTLNGSDNADVFSAAVGGDIVNAGGGNDSINLTNISVPNGVGGYTPPSTHTGAGGTWDGGTGTDVISVGGQVVLAANLLNIEGVHLQAAFTSVSPFIAKQDAALLVLDSAHAAMLPSNAFFAGTGTVEFDITNGLAFSTAGYVIANGAIVDFIIDASEVIGNNLTYTGSAVSDTILLGFGTQTALGGDGNDLLVFGGGSQSLTGGAGADRFSLSQPVIGTITDFTIGQDKFDFTDTTIINRGRLFDLLSAGTGSGAVMEVTVVEGPFQVTFQGVALANLSISDFILGADDPGNESDFGTAANESMWGGSGNDELHGGGGADRMYGGGGIDMFFGDDGDDTIILDGATAFGGTYDGGTGTDTLLLRENAGSVPNGSPTTYNVFPGAPGTGLVSVERAVFDSSASFALTLVIPVASSVTEAVGGAGTDVLVLVAGSAGTYSDASTTLTNWSGADRIGLSAQTGTSFNVTFNGRNDVAQFLIGQGGNDTLNGGALGDLIRGGAGTDTLTGGGGIDQLYGEAGDDTIVLAGSGAGSLVDGGEGVDKLQINNATLSLGTLVGIEQVEFINGPGVFNLTSAQLATGLSSNTALSGTGSLIVTISAGNQVVAARAMTVAGGSTIDFTLIGSTGIDIVKGVFGATNTLSGDTGSDQLVGGALADTINGGDGGDKIRGDGGADLLTGGAGNDVFKLRNVNDSGLGAAADKISDFAIGFDRINVSKIDANAGVAGDQAFAFIGTAAFANSGSGQIRYEDSGADLYVQADVNGDGIADMGLILQGLAGQPLTSASFVL